MVTTKRTYNTMQFNNNHNNNNNRRIRVNIKTVHQSTDKYIHITHMLINTTFTNKMVIAYIYIYTYISPFLKHENNGETEVWVCFTADFFSKRLLYTSVGTVDVQWITW